MMLLFRTTFKTLEQICNFQNTTWNTEQGGNRGHSPYFEAEWKLIQFNCIKADCFRILTNRCCNITNFRSLVQNNKQTNKHTHTDNIKIALACKQDFKAPMKMNAIHCNIYCEKYIILKTLGSAEILDLTEVGKAWGWLSPNFPDPSTLVLRFLLPLAFGSSLLWRTCVQSHFKYLSNHFSHNLENMFPDFPLREVS